MNRRLLCEHTQTLIVERLNYQRKIVIVVALHTFCDLSQQHKESLAVLNLLEVIC